MKNEAQRPLGVTLLAVLNILGGIGAILLGFVWMALSALFAQIGGPIAGGGLFALFGTLIVALGFIFLSLGILAIAVGWGFWKGSSWSWTVGFVLYLIGIVLSVISLAVGDVASIVIVVIGALIVYYLFRPNVKAWFQKPDKTSVSGTRRVSKTLAAGIIFAIIAIAAVVGFGYYFGWFASEPAVPETGRSLRLECGRYDERYDEDWNLLVQYTVYAKNIGTGNLKVRLEVKGEEFMQLIVNGELQRAWMLQSETSGWTDVSSDFQIHLTKATRLVDEAMNWLSEGGKFIWTDPISNEPSEFLVLGYHVDCTIDDSLFRV